MEKIRMCLVGVGSIGRRHLRLLNERDDVTLSVVEPYEASWERVTKEIGTFRRFTSLDEALASGEIDAVVIATPHGMHAKMAIQALEAGVHVFCEKPMSDSLEECVAMVKAAKNTDKVFSCGFMFHFDPHIQKMKEILDSGRLGKLLHFTNRFGSYNILLCSITKHQAHTPYSVIMDCIHDTDLLYYFTGRIPDHVYMNGFQAGDMELSSPQNVVDAIYRYDSGDLGANCHFNYIQHPQVHTLELVCEKGYMRYDLMEPSITVGTIDKKVEKITIELKPDDVYRAEWEGFLSAVRGERKPENDADSAIVPTLLMAAQRESAETGKEVSIRELAERCGYTY